MIGCRPRALSWDVCVSNGIRGGCGDVVWCQGVVVLGISRMSLMLCRSAPSLGALDGCDLDARRKGVGLARHWRRLVGGLVPCDSYRSDALHPVPVNRRVGRGRAYTRKRCRGTGSMGSGAFHEINPISGRGAKHVGLFSRTGPRKGAASIIRGGRASIQLEQR